MTDKQFLAGVWQKAAELEYQEMELQKAKERDRQIRRQNIRCFIGVLVLLSIVMPLLFVAPILRESLYLIIFVAFLYAFWMDMKRNDAMQEL